MPIYPYTKADHDRAAEDSVGRINALHARYRQAEEARAAARTEAYGRAGLSEIPAPEPAADTVPPLTRSSRLRQVFVCLMIATLGFEILLIATLCNAVWEKFRG